jgi:hypothetical protein
MTCIIHIVIEQQWTVTWKVHLCADGAVAYFNVHPRMGLSELVQANKNLSKCSRFLSWHSNLRLREYAGGVPATQKRHSVTSFAICLNCNTSYQILITHRLGHYFSYWFSCTLCLTYRLTYRVWTNTIWSLKQVCYLRVPTAVAMGCEIQSVHKEDSWNGTNNSVTNKQLCLRLKTFPIPSHDVYPRNQSTRRQTQVHI